MNHHRSFILPTASAPILGPLFGYTIGRALCLLLLALCLVGPAGRSLAQDEPPLEKITLQLKWKHQFQFAGFYAAIQQGYYREVGMDVQLVEGGPYTDAAEELASGRAQYAVGMTSMLVNRAKGQPIVALAVIFQHSPEALLTLAENNITTPHQLHGKRIMASAIDTPAVMAMFQDEGMPGDSLTLVDYDFDMSKMQRGEIEAMSCYVTTEPAYFEERGVPYFIIQPRNYGVDFYGDCLFTSEEEIAKRPDRARAFREASLRGWVYAMSHQKEMIDLILSQYKMHLDIGSGSGRRILEFEAAKTEELMFSDLIEVGHMNPGRWQHIVDTYVKLGMIEKGFTLDGFLYDPDPKVDLTLLYWLLGITGVVLLIVMFFAAQQTAFNVRLRAAEHEIRVSQNMLKLVLDTIPVRVFWKDRESIYQGCNQAFASDAGLGSPADVIGKSEHAMPWHDRADAYLKIDQQVYSSGEPLVDYEESIELANGESRAIRTSKIPLCNDQDETIGVLGVYEDITQFKRTEIERIELIKRIQQAQKFESLATLSGGVAHHFNNLLQIIIGNTEMALYLANEPTKVRSFLEQVKSASERASDLSTQMLSCAGTVRPTFRPLELSTLVRDLVPTLEVSIDHRLRLLFAAALEPLPVVADSGQLRQMLINLVTNAADAYGDEGGDITLSTGLRDCDTDYLTEAHSPGDLRPGTYTFLDVVDTGIGMSRETLDRVFDPFFSTKFTGRGLGMASVLGIVRAHNGTIKIQSTPGKGTQIRVLLPLHHERPAPIRPDVQVPKSWTGSGTLLLVDDEAPLLELGRGIFGTLGFKVVTAQSGSEALAVYRQHRDDIVCAMLDMVMPGMDGVQTLTALRDINPALPAIIVTGFSRDATEDAFANLHVEAIVHKPYEVRAVHRLLYQILTRSADAASEPDATGDGK